MNIERLILSVSMLIASLSLALIAVTWTVEQREQRDACARLADLGTGVGWETAARLSAPSDAPDELNITMLRDCLTD